MKILNLKLGVAVQLLAIASLCTFGSCSNWNNTQRGTAVGAGAGGALGTVIGNRSGRAGEGAVLGAVIGGATGAAIGLYMDKQAEQIEELENAEVERVGEGIKVTFDSGILFAVNSSDLTPESQETIMKFADILNEYPDTNLYIEGHTDNTGTHAHNKKLSKRRADAVKNYLTMQQVKGNRIETGGYSFDRPVADNETEAGRTKNRRVEVIILASEELIEKAEKGDIEKK